MARFTITINATLNGKTCKNPQIEFIQGSDVIYPCEISGNQITIETLPGTNPNACIEGYIKCDDDCLNCPPQYFKKCLCNDVTLLNSCQICKDGLIEEICTPEEIAAGKICSPNGCICPPDKPITDPNTGQCVVCITGTVSPTNPCQICIAGGWAIVDCGPNERCVNGECECIPPYVKDPLTGECKLKDECLDDEDCPTCKTCILGKCEPVVCPEGFQCINDECVPACTNVNCNNGADCGENCGCLDGKCVPCTILSCLDEASCQAALGCKCTGGDCVPVDDCNQNCEDNPCVDPGCTCYNGECVNCENFPCTDAEGGCNSYYNCQCNDEGKCEGGKDCEDTFELKKKEVCSADGCELEAVYNTKNKCMCDPIEFRVKNTEDCSIENPTGTGESLLGDTLLRLSIEMFKKGIPYAQFKTSDKFSDNEIVTGSIKVIVNAGGVDLPAITSTITANNIIPSITIEKPQTLPANNKKVKVSVFTQSIRVNDNGCTSYDNKEIATYDFDLAQSATIYCAKQNQYKTPKIFKLEDSTSTKKPLIVWYRTSGNDFGTTPVSLTSTDYAAKGYFRKKYLTGVAGSFSDKISKPEEGLLNNFRYKVTIDCGCEGANEATTGDVVIYCCPKDWTIVPDGNSCGKKVTIKAFTNCSVNNPFLDTTKYPLQSITTYYVSVNGKAFRKLDVYANEDIVLEETEPIKSLAFYQGYAGSTSKPPVVTKACEKSYNFNPVLPDFTVNTSLACTDGVITVELPSTGPAASTNPNPVTLKLTTYGPTLNLKPTSNPRIFTTVNSGPDGAGSNAEIATEIKKSNTAKVTVNFAGGCTNMKEVPYTCAPKIDTDAEPNAFAKASCGGNNPKIVVTPSGFGNSVVYSLNGGAFQTSNEFLNVAAGTYTITAKEIIDGQEVIVTDQIVINPAITPTIVKKDICGNTPGEIKLTGGAPGSTWSLNGVGISNNQLSLDSNGDSPTILVPATGGGVYIATLLTDPSGASCSPQSLNITINKGGGQVTPQIIVQSSSVCRGGEVLFRINDGGSNLTYNVQVDGQSVGFITDLNDNIISQVTASNTFNAKLKLNPQSNSTSATIRITSIAQTSNCFSLSTGSVVTTITVSNGPSIGNHTISCSQNIIGRYNVTVEVFGAATEVTIAGVSLTNTSQNIWSGQDLNIAGSGLNVVINSSNSGLCPSQKQVTLLDCTDVDDFCPPQTILIAPSPQSPTCGSVDVAIGFLSSNITPLAGQEYAWYEIIGSVQSMISSGTIVGTAPPALQILSTSTPREYMLAIKTKNGACEYYSNIVEVVAGTELNPIIFGAGISPDTTTLVTGSTYSYSTGLIPGATYSWTLTNSNGSNQPIGTNSNTISISSFTGGSNTINVTVTLGACTGSSSAIVNVGLTCPQVSIGYVAQSGDNTCKNLAATINNSPVGVTPVSYIWYVDGVSTQTGTGVPAIFDASAVLAGDTVDITIQITFSNGCIVTGPINPSTGLVDPFEYTRCSCLCSNNTCVTSFTPTSVAGQTLVYNTPAGISSDIYVWFKAGGFPDRLTIEKGAILLLDTLQVGKGVPYAIEKTLSLIYNSILLDDISTPVGTLLQTYTTQSYTGTCASSTPVSPLISPIVNTVLGVVAERSNNYGQLNGEVGVYVKIPFSAHNGQSLTLTGIPSQVEMCANPSSTHQSNQAIFQISCSPILEAGTI